MTRRPVRASLHRPSAECQQGVTLVELMVSLALGLLVVLVTTGLLLSTRTGYLSQDDQLQLHDSARYAMEVIARSLRQAGYENWDATTAPVLASETMSASLAGLDGQRLNARKPGLEEPVSQGVVNGSDVLAVRYFGSGPKYYGDGSVLNCAGFSVAAPEAQESAEDERGWSIFYVATTSQGESALYCKYRGKGSAKQAGSWNADAIATGVESFQVLYGVDLDAEPDGIPDRYLRATELDALDASLVLEGAGVDEQAADLNRKTHWKRVVVVRIAMLMRGNHAVRSDTPNQIHDLFGPEYSASFSASDKGVQIDESDLPEKTRNRPRRVFSTTIQLRNAAGGSAT